MPVPFVRWISVMDGQLKASHPNVVLQGIVTDVSPVQKEKAYPSMLVTLSGIVMDVNPSQL